MTNIIFRGPVYSQSGYGIHSKDIVTSLWNSGKFNISILPTAWGDATVSDTHLNFSEKNALETMSTNLLHKEASFIFIHVGIPTEFQKIGKINVGITAGLETNYIPKEWVDGCNLMDLVIVPSSIIKDIFIQSGVTSNIEVVEEGVDINVFKPMENNERVQSKLLEKIDTPINILCTGQWLTPRIGEDRKGIGFLVNTFLDLFKNRKDVGLILKTYFNNNSTIDFHNVKNFISNLKGKEEYPKIHIIHGSLTEEEMAKLYNDPKITCYASLTSGEGWGRGVAEAISCDVPVVVTGWGGHMHYINKEYVATIDFSMQSVPKSTLRYPWFKSDMLWAYPDLKNAQRKITRILDNPATSKERATNAGIEFRKLYSKDVVYDKLVRILNDLGNSIESGDVSDLKLLEINKF